ncbi:unnamed protein product, partial [Iphiclides podalirius]
MSIKRRLEEAIKYELTGMMSELKYNEPVYLLGPYLDAEGRLDFRRYQIVRVAQPVTGDWSPTRPREHYHRDNRIRRRETALTLAHRYASFQSDKGTGSIPAPATILASPTCADAFAHTGRKSGSSRRWYAAVHRPRGNVAAAPPAAKRLAFRTNDTNKILARIGRPRNPCTGIRGACRC